MEATEKSVSSETSLFPDGLTDYEKRILEVLRKAKVREDRHMTKERISTELGARGHEVAGIWHEVDGLRKKGVITERVDTMTKESCFVLANGTPKPVIHRKTYESVAAAALRSKVKALYEDGFKYEEIRLQLGIPRGTVSTVVRRLVAKGEIKPRGQGKRGAISQPKSTEIDIPIVITDASEEAEDDEAEDDPSGATLMEKLKKIVDELEQRGFRVKVLIEIHYGKLELQGAS